MERRAIGPFSVLPLGLGCMNLSHAYGAPPSPAATEALLAHALDRGIDFFDTAALYGFGENEKLVGRVLRPYRSRVLLASKCGLTGIDGKRVLDGRPEVLKRTCEESLARLGTDVIDLYYLHRWDRRIPIEDSIGALADLVGEGKIRAIGLSEVSAATLRRAHAIHPIAAVQTEYSLWTRNAEIAVIDACRELGAAFVAFSPLARAFLTGTLTDPERQLSPPDLRLQMPRFEAAHYARNLALLPPYLKIAKEKGCTPAQLALAWLLAKAGHILPIFGTRSIEHLDENLGALAVARNSDDGGDWIRRLDALINERTVAGLRYNAAAQADAETEQFPFEKEEQEDVACQA
jgi:hypothetical protein